MTTKQPTNLAVGNLKPTDAKLKCNSMPISQSVGGKSQGGDFNEQLIKIYQRVNSLKIHLDMLTLQPAGTKYIAHLTEYMKPIFTIDCQLSRDLIRDIPRSDSYHTMQFESIEYQNTTQCAHFEQEAQRDIHLQLKLNEKDLKLNFGKLSFIVWWHKPGTRLNEMLGMAMIDLEELYQASLFEQSKCLLIKRRDEYMANLYLKISLLPNRN